MTASPSTPVRITSRSNPLVQRLRRLAQDPAAYRQHGEVWVEGEHLCAEVVQCRQPVGTAVVTESAWQVPALQRLSAAALQVVVVADAVMALVSALESPPPLAFVLPWGGAGAVQPGLDTVVLDRLQDAGNVGTVLRSAAAFGVRQVVAMKGCAALWSPKVLRAGMGAHWRLQLVEQASDHDLDRLAVPLIATSSHAPQALTDQALPSPCAWALGHEGQGLSAALQARCHLSLRIPQPGGLESLNVAAAATVCFYEAARQRLSAHG